ncbi:MAG: hypothetical protein WCH46_00010 [bacterium]
MKTLNRLVLFCMVGTAAMLASCKDSGTTVNVSHPQKQVGAGITTDTLPATPVKGTLLAGHTYYFTKDIIVNAGDTLLMQSGVKLICLRPANLATPGPQLSITGTFISLGTKDAPNWITVPDAQKTYDHFVNGEGLWGGIQCAANSGDLIMKWTHVEYCGGPGEVGEPIAGSQGHRYIIWFQTPASHVILEDSWFRGAVDDPIRISGGKISVMRNTWEWGGTQGGDGLNIKSGTVGDIAYNTFIGCATNGPKLSNKGGATVQTNVNIYNNTMINCGWRRQETGRAGSTNIEEGARGTEYNNLIVNCRTGFRLVSAPAADSNHVFYDYQYYYAQDDSIRLKFYIPGDGIQKAKPHDIAGATKANDPQFVGYDVNQFDFNSAPLQYVTPIGNQPHGMNEQGSSNFNLKPTSPAAGKGVTTVPADAAADGVTIPMTGIVPEGGDLGATRVGLGKDIGAYQLDGTGNVH